MSRLLSRPMSFKFYLIRGWSSTAQFCNLGNAVLSWDTSKALANNFFALIIKDNGGITETRG